MRRVQLGSTRRGRLRCPFCHEGANDVARLVAGASAYICDTCISQCVAILRQHGGFEEPTDPAARRH